MAERTRPPGISGVSHLDLSVVDADASAAWYERVLGLTRTARVELAERTMVVLVDSLTGLVIGLNQHHRHDEPASAGADRFDERRTGLDHVGFAVARRQDLDAWQARLAEFDVTHSPVADTDHGSALVFRDPDNIQLELWWTKLARATPAQPTPDQPTPDQPGPAQAEPAQAEAAQPQPTADAAVIERMSPVGVEATVARLVASARAAGVTVFATIDHAENARTAGLAMPETRVVIVGNPALGTPAMLEAPDIAIELPTRLLVRATPVDDQRATVVFSDPAATAQRFGLSKAAAAGLAGVAGLVERALDPEGTR